jgi:hypothetical protein
MENVLTAPINIISPSFLFSFFSLNITTIWLKIVEFNEILIKQVNVP